MSKGFVLLVSLASSVLAFYVGYRISHPVQEESDSAVNIVAAKSSISMPTGVVADRDALPSADDDEKNTRLSGSAEKSAATSVDTHASRYEQSSEYADGYQEYEAQVQQDIPTPGWFYMDRNVYDEVAAADPMAAVAQIKCGDSVCRAEILHVSEQARERFARSISGSLFAPEAAEPETMSPGVTSTLPVSPPAPVTVASSSTVVNSATAYHYPDDDPTKTIMYILKTESPEEVMQKLQAKLGM